MKQTIKNQLIHNNSPKWPSSPLHEVYHWKWDDDDLTPFCLNIESGSTLAFETEYICESLLMFQMIYLRGSLPVFSNVHLR